MHISLRSVKHRPGHFVSEYLLQLTYLASLIIEFRALIRMHGLWWAENAGCSLDDGMSYCSAAFLRTGTSTANRVRWSIIERM